MRTRRSRWIRRTLVGVVVLALVGAGLAWQFLLRPSGDLADYSRFLVDDRTETPPGAVTVTAMGTTMMLVDDGTTQVLIDPYITEVNLWQAALNSPLTTDASAVDAALDRAGATRVEAILVSHSHFDHALDLAHVANRTGATVYGSESTLNVARGGDVPEDRLRAFDESEEITAGDFRIQALPSRHTHTPFDEDDPHLHEPLDQSESGWRDYKEGGTFDFLLSGVGPNMLFKGSANWEPGALDGLDVDALFLGVGAFGRADDDFADGYLDATIGALRPTLVVPTHWNDFFAPVEAPLPFHRKVIDDSSLALDRVAGATENAGIRVALLDAFSRIHLDDDT